MAIEIGSTLEALRRHAQANQWYDRAIALHPDQTKAYLHKSLNYLGWLGDIRAARDAIESVPRERVENAAFGRFYMAFVERDWQAALDALAATPDETLEVLGGVLPRVLAVGMVQQYRGEFDRARKAYDSARRFLEGRLQEGRAEEGSARSFLGIAYAGLGLKDEAIREGRRGVDLCPASHDVIRRYARVENLALIYTMVGESDAALGQLEHLLSACGS